MEYSNLVTYYGPMVMDHLPGFHGVQSYVSLPLRNCRPSDQGLLTMGVPLIRPAINLLLRGGGSFGGGGAARIPLIYGSDRNDRDRKLATISSM